MKYEISYYNHQANTWSERSDIKTDHIPAEFMDALNSAFKPTIRYKSLRNALQQIRRKR